MRDPLAPWRPELDALAGDAASTLGPLLVRLDPLLGHGGAAATHGEPDGYSGIGRRGSFDRLLPTSWALADVAPEEFTRRAADGEHLFVELARRSPATGRSIALITDEGAEQLGAPRLVHLALAIALGRRARAAKVPMMWSPADRLRDEPLIAWESETSPPQLIRARSCGRPEPARIERRIPKDADVWLVGGRTLMSTPGKANRVLVREQGDKLAVVVDRVDGTHKELLLERPSVSDTVGLLRESLRSPIRRAAQASEVRGLAFAPNLRLLLATFDDRIVGIPFPPSKSSRNELAIPANRQLLGVGNIRGAPFSLVSARDDESAELRSLLLRRAPPSTRLPSVSLTPYADRRPVSILHDQRSVSGGKAFEMLYLLNDEGWLFGTQWVPEDYAERPLPAITLQNRVLAGGVRAIAIDRTRPGPLLVMSTPQGRKLAILHTYDSVPRIELVDPPVGPGDGRAILDTSWGVGRMAVEVGPEWVLSQTGAARVQEIRLPVAEGETVLGIAQRRTFGLIVRTEDGIVARDGRGEDLLAELRPESCVAWSTKYQLLAIADGNELTTWEIVPAGDKRLVDTSELVRGR